MNEPDREDSVTLEILQAIDEKENVTQRHLSKRLGLALGLTNSYLKRCARKGLIKIQQAPANRYLYYLTPQGLAEKSRLTAKYLTISFNFYRDASSSINYIYALCAERQFRQILLCGVSELAEIAVIRSHDYPVNITGVFDPAFKKSCFLNLPVWNDFDLCESFDALLLTELVDSQKMYEDMVTRKLQSEVLVPRILGISKQ